MEKVIISEDKIKEFIAKNDKRNGAQLDKHKELIKRLIDEKISLNAIYVFIFENDNTIGNKSNFYKYVSRNYSTIKAPTKPKEKEVTKLVTSNLTPATATAKPINAKDILSQNFDLLEFSK